MEPNLKNSCHVNRRVLRKAYNLILRPRTLLMLGLCLLMLAVWVLYLAVVPAAERETWVTLALPILTIIYAVLALLTPGQYVRTLMKRLQESRQIKEYESKLIFSPEELIVCFDYSQDQIRMPYKELRKVLVTKDLLLLKTKAKQFYLLDPQRFENGTEADFWKLMNQRCPKAVPKALRTAAPTPQA